MSPTPEAFVSVVIPALDEEGPIGDVVRAVWATNIPYEIIVADNGSTDRTAERAREAGARVVSQPAHGYGRACAAGIAAISPNCDIVMCLDGDGSDCPELMDRLVKPIARGEADFVIGSRTRGQREPGSMNFQQIFAGHAAGFLLRLLYGVKYTDMSPFRAIRRPECCSTEKRRAVTQAPDPECDTVCSARRPQHLPLPEKETAGSPVSSLTPTQSLLQTRPPPALHDRKS